MAAVAWVPEVLRLGAAIERTLEAARQRARAAHPRSTSPRLRSAKAERRRVAAAALLEFFGDCPVSDFAGAAGAELVAGFVVFCARGFSQATLPRGIALLRRALETAHERDEADCLPTVWPTPEAWIRAKADLALERWLSRARGGRRMVVGPRSIVFLRGPSRHERAALRLDFAEFEAAGVTRPKTRADCPPPDTACPWYGCRHHLGAEVERKKSGLRLKVIFPDRDVDELPETCSLTVAERFRARDEDKGRDQQPLASFAEVARLMNVTANQVEHYERSALRKLRHLLVLRGEEPTTRRPPSISDGGAPGPGGRAGPA